MIPKASMVGRGPWQTVRRQDAPCAPGAKHSLHGSSCHRLDCASYHENGAGVARQRLYGGERRPQASSLSLVIANQRWLSPAKLGTPVLRELCQRTVRSTGGGSARIERNRRHTMWCPPASAAGRAQRQNRASTAIRATTRPPWHSGPRAMGKPIAGTTSTHTGHTAEHAAAKNATKEQTIRTKAQQQQALALGDVPPTAPDPHPHGVDRPRLRPGPSFMAQELRGMGGRLQ